MNFRQRVLGGELVTGTWLNLGSTVTAEMASVLNFDWALIDREHGVGDQSELLTQLQAIGSNKTVPIVRIPYRNEGSVKLALDLGAGGIMVPYVESAEEAAEFVSWCKYPPAGRRGAAKGVRASAYGTEFETYFPEANESILTVVQIESQRGVQNVQSIANVPGVDVLFVGPFDLSINLGIREQYDHLLFIETTDAIISAAKSAGKPAGILVLAEERVSTAVKQGYTFVACGSDGGHVFSGLKRVADIFENLKSK